MNLSKYAKSKPTVEECDDLIVEIYEMMGFRFPEDTRPVNGKGWVAFGKAIKVVNNKKPHYIGVVFFFLDLNIYHRLAKLRY